MDTKTAKEEAWYILSAIERGSDDVEFIGEARRKFYALMKARGCDRSDYLDNFDACLSLFGDIEYHLVLHWHSRRGRHYSFTTDPLDKVSETGKTPELAILAWYWRIQP
jgi:hypothetical protein